MTGSAPSTPPPGWYPDPDGTPGQVRWWHGTGWSDVTTPAGPGVAVSSSPVLAPPEPPRQPETFEGDPASADADRRAWIVVLSVLALVIAVVAGVLVGRGGNGSTTAAEPPSSASVEPPAGRTLDPGTVRIIDRAAGISYPYLGESWFEWSLGSQYEMTTVAGQYFTTQEDTPDAGIFIAQCTSGPLAEGYGWAGPATLGSTVATLADSVRANYYPGPNERRIMRDEARTVDGHAAHLVEFQLTWDVPGYDASGERAALLLIDTGRPEPALVYISIPNTHAELYGVIDRVLEDIDVL